MYDKLANLELEVSDLELIPLEKRVPAFVRKSTLIRLSGKGTEGIGEDVTYDSKDHEIFQTGSQLHINGRYTLASFFKTLDETELWTKLPIRDASRYYRRWAFESAALSLALKQNDTTLEKALGLEAKPLNFVVSTGLPKGDVSPISHILNLYPKMRFKLDPTSDWTDDTIEALRQTKAVDVLDFKGHYKGTLVDRKVDLELYRKLIDAFPEALIEDPHTTKEVLGIIKPHAARVTWDAPLHSLADIKSMPIQPKIINVKPSRFGTLKELFSVYDYCMENEIGMYGGGQFELGHGRHQIQHLASLFHPDTPNDVAPAGFNATEIPPDLPVPPLLLKGAF